MPENDLKGTANLIHQHSAYKALEGEYGEQTATVLASKNLARNGIDVPPEGVAHWDKVNNAAIQGQLNIDEERAKAEALASQAMGTAIQNASAENAIPAEAEAEEEEEEEFVDDDDEAPTLQDMYGYDNDEDNEEAALDDILKIQEKG